MTDLFRDYQKYHSEFQLERFIVGDELTEWGAYQQTLHELWKRKAALERTRIELAKLRIEIRRKKRRIRWRRFYWSVALDILELERTQSEKRRIRFCASPYRTGIRLSRIRGTNSANGVRRRHARRTKRA